ncbi:MAG: hypothetical protein V9E89_07850 [Ilumatobacteraceae bacterium]
MPRRLAGLVGHQGELRFHEVLGGLQGNGVQQVQFRGEVVVQARRPDPHGIGDGAHAHGGESVLGEQLGGGGGDGGAA